MNNALKLAKVKRADSKKRVENSLKFKAIALDTQKALDNVLAKINKDTIVAFDCESTSLDTKKAKIVGFSFAFNTKEAFYVPILHNYLGVSNQISLDSAKIAITKILDTKVVGQNLKYDLSLIKNIFNIKPKVPF